MNYYVIGTVDGKLVLLCSKAFGTRQEANHYADSCYASYRAFVVVDIEEDI